MIASKPIPSAVRAVSILGVVALFGGVWNSLTEHLQKVYHTARLFPCAMMNLLSRGPGIQ